MSAGDIPDVLITIPISHYCEKARWALDRAGLGYVERPHLQVFHWAAVRRAGGGKTAPVLVRGDRVLADSADIVEEASAEAPPERRFFPDDPGAAAEVRDLAARLRHQPWTARAPLDVLRPARPARHRDRLRHAPGVPAWQRRALPFVYPRGGPGHRPGTSRSRPPRRRGPRPRCTRIFDEVGERLGDGRPYLCGERFTAADLTFAALAASVLMPPEYGVPLPQPEELPARWPTTVRELRAHPAGAHALAMFRDER